jgi:hypothetical protein
VTVGAVAGALAASADGLTVAEGALALSEVGLAVSAAGLTVAEGTVAAAAWVAASLR